MIERRRYMGLTALPYEYEVEYLESNGNQWIDTGVYAKNISVIKTKLYHGGNGSFGCRRQSPMHTYGFWGAYFYHGSAFQQIDINKRLATVIIDEPNGVVTVDLPPTDTYTYTISGSFTESIYPIMLFAWNVDGQVLFKTTGTKIYYFNISENGATVIDLIPVVKDNIGCMYDKVSDTLFYNQGTVDFIIGPRV